MNKYQDMARQGIEEQNKARETRQREQAEAQRRSEEREAAEQQVIDQHIYPVLSKAARGLSSGGVEAQAAAERTLLRRQVTVTIGHNRAGRTGERVATLTAWAVGDQLHASVDSDNGPLRSWTNHLDSSETTLDEAIADSLDRWFERNGYPARRY